MTSDHLPNPAVDLRDYDTTGLLGPEAVSKFIEVEGFRTHYLEFGNPGAPKLVLVHGAACSIGLGVERWHPVVKRLAKTFHVFAPEELGHGRTDPPRRLQDLGHTRKRADHILAFLQAMKLGQVHLLGQSQGCWIAAYVALVMPSLISRLILVDSASTSGVETAKPPSESELLPYTQRLFKPGTRIPSMDLQTKEGIRHMIGEFCLDPSRVTEPLVEHALQLAKVWGPAYQAQDNAIWQDGKLAGMAWRQEQYSYQGRHISYALPSIALPTLVMWGRESNKGLDAGFAMYKSLPNAQMHILDKANHFLWFDRTDAFCDLVTWFLEAR